jgi:hypothetical protein
MFQITAYERGKIVTFQDWAEKGLPPERRDMHWVEGRSAFELGREWTKHGAPAVPWVLRDLLESRPETQGASMNEVLA